MSSQIYFNDRLHELKSNSIDKFSRDPQAHERVIIQTLYVMREALQAYRPDDTLMVPRTAITEVERKQK